ncbi:26S proteasome regulatory subunit, putative [Theileria annulata]|uniref:26S proteasome regulatory subunit, putative n=1 Tax=Theileria annulata TaxID=5874 RepID=Q4U9R8_THEAN|nr:26S proteasome regulatory subunit, putative [Theileria annulata]CAI76435.1 26S proteasome regulatory subunit, putative [Theileria annulata]|eukprot:XP_953060.1 26S proteasome regulatory subunit, putative [Theileria annulata]
MPSRFVFPTDLMFRNDNATVTTLKSLPNFEIEKLRHLFSVHEDLGIDPEKIKKPLLDLIKQNHMFPYYERIKPKLGIIEDDFEIESFKELNAKTLAELDEKIEFAEKNFGSSEIKDSILDKGNYYFKIGDHENTVRVYEQALEKTVGINSKLEIMLTILRAAFFFNDLPLLVKYMEKAKLYPPKFLFYIVNLYIFSDIEKGGDWELRNRLHIYEAVQLMLCRKFKEATELFLESLSTFTATELISLEELVLYSIVLSLITMGRNVINKKVLLSSEVAQVASPGSSLYQLISDYYNCNYKNYMKHLGIYVLDINFLVDVSKLILKDRYLGRHCRYFVRQARLPAYKQFLRPYKSVTLKNMADAFQVSTEFIEEELVSYISGMRLDCKIDKVNGIIENNVGDERNNNYVKTIKQVSCFIHKILRAIF